MHFSSRQKVLFRHCDPAGIVFYPRCFEIINDAVEALFSDLIGWPFEDLHPANGVPTVAIDVVFKAPSRHGDQLDLGVTIRSLGASSMTLQIIATLDSEVRFSVNQTIVCVNESGRPLRWPDPVRDKINQIMATTQ